MRERPVPRWSVLTSMFSVPLLALVLTAAVVGLPASKDIMATLDRAGVIEWGSSSLSWAPETFAPLLPALTSAAGSWVWAPVLFAGVAFAGFLASVVRAARLQGWSAASSGSLALAFAGLPILAVTLTNPSRSLTITLLLISLASAAMYTQRGNLLSFWTSGLALSLAVFSSSNAWAGALAAILAASWMVQRRFPSQKWAGVGSLAVIGFPPVIASLFWVYVAWWFTPDASNAALLMVPRAGTFDVGILAGVAAAVPVLLYSVIRNWRCTLLPALLMLASAPWVAPDPGAAFLLATGAGVALLLAGPTPARRALIWLSIIQATLGSLVVFLLST